MPWPKVQRRIAQLIKEDWFFTEEEQDRFDDIDPVAIREALEQRGIVDGQVVDPEKLEQDPFIRQVTADVERIAQEEQTQAPVPSGPPFTRQDNTSDMPAYTEETVAVYPADKNNLPYDIEIRTLRVPEPKHDPPKREAPDAAPGEEPRGTPVAIQIDGEWQTFPNVASAEKAAYALSLA